MKTNWLDPTADLAIRLWTQAQHCAKLGSPFYAGLLERASEDAAKGGPAREILQGHETDPPNSMLALRLMGAVHRRVLEGRLPELEPFYLFSGGSNDRQARKSPTAAVEEAWLAFRAALVEDAEALRPLIDRPVQTNEVGRCAALLPGFFMVAERTGMPLHLLEVGASAGLNLRWDRYRYEAGGFSWGNASSQVRIHYRFRGALRPTEVAVAERRGCDRAPLDPVSEEGRLALLSFVWPDQVDRLERLRAALGVASEMPVTVEHASAVEWVRDRLARPRPGVASVLFHSIVIQYLEADEREELLALIRLAGDTATAEAPLAWLRMEPAGDRAEVRVTSWPGGEEALLATAGYHGDPVELAR
jgi:hypothetical protein